MKIEYNNNCSEGQEVRTKYKFPVLNQVANWSMLVLKNKKITDLMLDKKQKI